MSADWTESERVHERLQEVIGADDKDGGVVVKWALVAEVMQPSGYKNVQYLRGPNEQSCPMWDWKGLLHQALFDPDSFNGDDDDG